MSIITINNVKFVDIDPQDSILVERKFYEHQAGRDNIAFLMKEKDINWEILQHYIDVVETRWVELELLKKEMGDKYCPEEYKDDFYSYEFLFDKNMMKFVLEVR